MGQMLDSANPANIPADLDGMPALRITVLANPAGQCFDYETGNAGASSVAAGCRSRADAGKWSVVYTDWDHIQAVTDALHLAGLGWSEASAWPAVGVYLWAADPSGNIARGTWRPPVTPLAVQGGQQNGCDVSVTADRFPARVAGYIDGPVSQWPGSAWDRFTAIPDTPTGTQPSQPSPPAPPPMGQPSGACNVNLPILSQGAVGPAVKAVQKLVGGVAVHGVFGPVTHQAVVTFQH